MKNLREMKNLRSSTSLVAVGVLAFLASAADAQTADTSCYRTLLAKELNMINSAVVAGRDVLVADSFKDQILTIGERAGVKVALPPLSNAEAADLGLPLDATGDLLFHKLEWLPSKVHTHGERIYVLLRRDWTGKAEDTGPWFSVVELDRDTLRPKALSALELPNIPWMVLRDFEIIAADGQTPQGILLYGTFPEHHTPGAFLYHEFGSGHASAKDYVIETVENEVEHNVYAHLNIKFMASIGSRAFLLLYRREGVELLTFEVTGDGPSPLAPINEVPLKYRDSYLPSEDLLALTGPERATYLLRELVEANAVAMGIYPWQGRLHLLIKDTAETAGGERKWRLRPLQYQKQMSDTPLQDRDIMLPTSAAHLTISMAAEHWMLIEKDRVQSFGKFGIPYTKTKTMAFVPTAWLRNPPSQKATCKIGTPFDNGP